jgi:hypothetical protein
MFTRCIGYSIRCLGQLCSFTCAPAVSVHHSLGVGRIAPLRPRPVRELARHLHPPAGEHPWPTRIPRGALDRFARDKEPIDVTLVEPLVVEVTADVAWSGTSYRHPLRFVRIRPEMRPMEAAPPSTIG